VLNRGVSLRHGPATSIIERREISGIASVLQEEMSLLGMREVFNLRFYNNSSRLTTDCGEEEKLSDWGKAPLFKFFRTLSTRL
jgi:hypothetical protein